MRLHLHLVSDSTGETVTTVARAAVSQFDGVVAVEHVWFFVRSREQVEKVMGMVEALPGLVVFTLVSRELRALLIERCQAANVPCVPILDEVQNALSRILGSSERPRVGSQHVMDDGYYSRIEALDFAFRHDDGQSTADLQGADVILVGVSRTSKTPTCVYLANRGIKAGNIPLVPQTPDLIDLAALTRPLVVGLSINPDSLVQIRRSRQKVMGLDEGASRRYGDDYADLERVREEVVAARRLFARMKWPVIDVTRRSVEETAASIYQMLKSRHDPDLDHLGGS